MSTIYYNVYSPVAKAATSLPIAVFQTEEVAVHYFVEHFWKFFDSIDRAKSVATLFIETVI